MKWINHAMYNNSAQWDVWGEAIDFMTIAVNIQDIVIAERTTLPLACGPAVVMSARGIGGAWMPVAWERVLEKRRERKNSCMKYHRMRMCTYHLRSCSPSDPVTLCSSSLREMTFCKRIEMIKNSEGSMTTLRWSPDYPPAPPDDTPFYFYFTFLNAFFRFFVQSIVHKLDISTKEKHWM